MTTRAATATATATTMATATATARGTARAHAAPPEPPTLHLASSRPRPTPASPPTPGPATPARAAGPGRPARPAGPRPRPTTPDLASVPGATWEEDTHAPFALAPAHAGIHLGTGRDGQPVTLPAPGPEGVRVAVLGEPLFGRLVALRLLAAGAVVTAATRDPAPWQPLRHAAAGRLVLGEDPAAWPPHPPAPPGVGSGPQALVSDQRRPPPPNAAVGPWRTVLHVAAAVPRRAAFWHRPAALLALDARHAESVGRLLGPEAADHTARLARGEIILFRPTSAVVLRPDIAPGETALLTPGQERSAPGAPR
ncbi:hypothetical protein ACTWP5_20930 [Streptomyces sp. 4N509B]|uniref:hypothetical protein n=1 Tax=Streptomyces sp. 4N509B TaxID=3457413 RepID=UPI003FD66038